MRKLLIPILLLLAHIASGQAMTGPTGYGLKTNFHKPLLGTWFPQVEDTTAAKANGYFAENTTNGTREGMIIQYTVDKQVYKLVKDGTNYYFVPLGGTTINPEQWIKNGTTSQTANFNITGTGQGGILRGNTRLEAGVDWWLVGNSGAFSLQYPGGSRTPISVSSGGVTTLDGGMSLINGHLSMNMDGSGTPRHIQLSNFTGSTHAGTVNDSLLTYDPVSTRVRRIAFSIPWSKITGAPGFEPAIAAGTTAQYWRGDKTFQTLNTTVVPEGTNLYWTNARGDARYPQLTGSYANPTWLTSLAWAKITGAPSSFPTTSDLQTVTGNGNTTTNSIAFPAAATGIEWRNSASIRWLMRQDIFPNSDFSLYKYDDAGVAFTVLRAARATGVVDFSLPPTRAGNTIWDANNHVAGSAFTPTLTGANVPASFTSNSAGHVTAFTTRALTPADIGAATASGSGNYIQNQVAGPQTANFHISGNGRANNQFIVSKDGANTANAHFQLYNSAATRGVTLQLNADANPGLATWIHDGSAYQKRMEIFATGTTQFYSNVTMSNAAATLSVAGQVNIGTIPAQGSAASHYLTSLAGDIQYRTTAQVLSDIGAAPASLSGNYIQNNATATAQAASFNINGMAAVQKDGSSGVNGTFIMYNAARSRGANFQLNGDATPGLSTYVHNGSAWIERTRISATTGEMIVFGENAEGISVSRAVATGGAATGGVRFNALNSASAPTTYAQIWGLISGNTAGAHNGSIAFNTANSGTIGSRMILNNLGNLLIGTTTGDGNRLQVEGTASVSSTITAPVLQSPSGDNLLLLANGAPTGSQVTLTNDGIGIGGMPGGTHTAKLLVAGNAVSTDAWVLDGGGVSAEFFLDGGTGAGVRTISNHPLRLYSNNTERMALNAAGQIEMKAGIVEKTTSSTSTAYAVVATDHVIKLDPAGTGGTGTITLPNPATSEGRELKIIAVDGATYTSNFSITQPTSLGPPTTSIQGVFIIQAIAGTWYLISKL